jgi:glycerol-3-phosphate acyltransferase PlsY
MENVAVLVISYLLGAIPIGLITGKLVKGVDIRQYGSGNIGATNVLRTLGPFAATIVFFGDTAKGLAAVLLAKYLVVGDYQPYYVVGAGLLSVIGHSASPFLRFKGGKGVATSLGIIIGFNWLIAAIAFGLWVTLVAVIRFVSIASIIASLSVPAMMFFSPTLFQGMRVPREFTICALAAALLILLRHRSNLKRLVKGTEPKFGQKVKLEENNGHE